MSEIGAFGHDLAENVPQAHGAEASGSIQERLRLVRSPSTYPTKIYTSGKGVFWK
ncbi:hypothetical protein U5903_20915 [Cereibacter johrii]|uniref:hypothetical protein n=1 Tax=Cereibacter johrii TaxID=445629 RepID=UPI002B25EAB3|nr:hypothetical protein [Cereibacter johrii]MEA5163254.1 hypothetical protein [Cereibacter johrii]